MNMCAAVVTCRLSAGMTPLEHRGADTAPVDAPARVASPNPRRPQHMTANTKARNEFKAVAREAAQLGARFVSVTRDWFDNRRQDAERPSGYYTRRGTPGGPDDDEERTYGRDEHAAASPATAAARRSGYRGVGPRGYTRSDQRIREDVCETLCDSDDIDAADINVDVSGGAVRLSGTVPSRAMKHRAEDVAESCSGVRDIENAIRVAGVDPVGGSQAYAGGTAGTSAYSAGAGGSAGPAGSATAGYGHAAPGASTPGTTGSGAGTATGSAPSTSAGATGGHRPDRAS
jgi:hypothetical protein